MTTTGYPIAGPPLRAPLPLQAGIRDDTNPRGPP